MPRTAAAQRSRGRKRNRDKTRPLGSFDKPSAEAFSLPSNFTARWDPGFNFSRRGNQFFTDFDASQYQPSGVAFYCAPGASGSGASVADPGSLSAGFSGTATNLILEPGFYSKPRPDTINRSLSIVCPNGRARITEAEQTTSWTASATPNVYTANALAEFGVNVVDTREFIEPDIRSFRVVPRTAQISDAAMESGTWRPAGSGVLSVRLNDDTVPDSEHIWAISGTGGDDLDAEIIWVGVTPNTQFYFENIFFEGYAFEVTMDATSTFTAKNCRFNYQQLSGGKSGLDFDAAGTVYLQNCDVSGSREDGLDANDNVNVYAQNSIFTQNGTGLNEDLGTNNGSTGHTDAAMLMVNCTFAYNQDRQVHDINNTKACYLGCSAGHSQEATPGENRAAFTVGRSTVTDATESWFYGCSSLGNVDYDLQVYAGATAHLDSASNIALTSRIEAGSIDLLGESTASTGITASLVGTGNLVEDGAFYEITVQYEEVE